MSGTKGKRIYVSPEFAKSLKLMAVECDKNVIDLTRFVKLVKPVFKSKKARWIDL